MKDHLSRLPSLAFCLLLAFPSVGQVVLPREALWVAAARREVDTLCAPSLAGRGYVDGGHRKAARYLAERFAQMGLEPAGTEDYWQTFPMEINLVSGAQVAFNGQPLTAGRDFIVSGFSGSGEGRFRVKDIGYGLAPPRRAVGKVLLLRSGFPPDLANDSEARAAYDEVSRLDQRIEALLPLKPAGFIVVQPKLTAAFTRQHLPVPVVEVTEMALPQRLKSVDWRIQAQRRQLRSQNVLARCPGRVSRDSFIVVTAHYDHLGRYAEALFAGANDNASGIAMLLSLAAHFKVHPLPYPILFIAFGGEEAGLVGSRYFATQQPLIPLERIKFLLNLDLLGNGSGGIMAVGGRDFPAAFDQLRALNDSLQAVPVVRARSNAPNSDHYFFLRRGVPGFFIYTMGGPPHYHDVHDTAANLGLSHFSEVRALLIHFLRQR